MFAMFVHVLRQAVKINAAWSHDIQGCVLENGFLTSLNCIYSVDPVPLEHIRKPKSTRGGGSMEMLAEQCCKQNHHQS